MNPSNDNMSELDEELPTTTLPIDPVEQAIFLREQQAQINQLNSNNNYLNQELRKTRQELANVSNTLPTIYPEPTTQFTSNSNTTIKINPPTVYTGNREETSQFLAQCSLVFEADPYLYSNFQKRIIYTLSFLRGDAFKWYEAAINRPKRKFESYEEFAELLRSTFGEEATASEDKTYDMLSSLRQTHSCQAYSTRFLQLASLINENPNSFTRMYKKGLKNEIQLHLVSLEPQPTTLHNTMAAAIRFDDRLYNLKFDNRHSPKSRNYSDTHQYRPLPFVPRNTNSFPMDLDTLNIEKNKSIDKSNKFKDQRNKNKRSAITEEEKQRRRDNHLCLYDGKSDCPGRDDISKCTLLLARPDFQPGRGPRQ